MNTMRICMIAQFPPPIHGLSKAVQTLYDSQLSDLYKTSKVNITNNKMFLWTVIRLLTIPTDVFYLTLSQSVGGNIRDTIIMLIALLRRKELVVHVHGGLHFRHVLDVEMPSFQSRITKKMLSHCTLAVVLSNSLIPNFEGIIPSKRIKVVENGVDSEYIPDKGTVMSDVAKRVDQPVMNVLYLSNMIESKGYKKTLEVAMLEAESVALGKKNKFRFMFAGNFFEDAERQYFQSFVRQHRLEKYVSYLGVVDGNRKAKLLKESSVFCLPTNYPIEGQPISILEAMVNGEYIISTKHGAIPDMVSSDGGKLLNVDTSAEEIFKVLNSLDQRQLLLSAEKNYETVMSRFTEDAYVARFIELFKDVEYSRARRHTRISNK